MSYPSTEDLRIIAVANWTNQRANGIESAPVTPSKTTATPPGTPHQALANVPPALTRTPVADKDRKNAAKLLREKREAIRGAIADDPIYQGIDGELKTDWFYRVAAMDTDDDGNLLADPDIPPRAPWTLTVEEIEQGRSETRPPKFPSLLRDEVKYIMPADPRAYTANRGHRRVGGVWNFDLKMAQGKKKEAAVVVTEEEVDMELDDSF